MPAAIAAETAGYTWARNDIGKSGGAVHRLHGPPGAPDLFLKHGRGEIGNDITDEMVRMRWLGAHVPAPKVRLFLGSPHEAWLLTTALPGDTAFQALEAASPDARPALVDALAAFLRRLHAIPISQCPFNSDLAFRSADARRRIEAGLVDEEDFDAERQGWTAAQVWDAMQSLLPFPPDPVVTHGDFSLDNILLSGSEVSGCIDTARVGIADRYQDIAILWNGLGKFDDALQQRFLAQYGLAQMDQRKLLFHLLLDELF